MNNRAGGARIARAGGAMNTRARGARNARAGAAMGFQRQRPAWGQRPRVACARG
jgi:hypothetical protein